MSNVWTIQYSLYLLKMEQNESTIYNLSTYATVFALISCIYNNMCTDRFIPTERHSCIAYIFLEFLVFSSSFSKNRRKITSLWRNRTTRTRKKSWISGELGREAGLFAQYLSKSFQNVSEIRSCPFASNREWGRTNVQQEKIVIHLFIWHRIITPMMDGVLELSSNVLYKKARFSPL